MVLICNNGGKEVEKKPSIIVSILAVVLLILGSLSNVVGYQSVQTSQQNIIKERINQRELLFQTIVDIANNKEIQRIILKSQMSRGIFPTLELPIVTKNQLKQMYFIGFILSKFINKSKIHSMVQQYQLFNPEIQQEISAVIEKNPTLKGEITQLQNSECDCEKNINAEKISITDSTGTPIICVFLFIVMTAMIVLSVPLIIIDEFLISIDLVLLILLILIIQSLTIGLIFNIASFLYDSFSCSEVIPI
jgi:hypothetical protein